MRRFACALFVVAACADASTDPYDTDEVVVDSDATVDATELRVRANDTTVWIDRAIRRDGDSFIMHGRTSRNITEGMGYIIDDPYGTFVQKSPRAFDVTWQVSEIRTLADGVDEFVRMGFAHSNGRPDSMNAHAVVQPRLGTFAGSTKIYLTAAVTPVVYAGDTVYRIAGHSYDANTEIMASLGGEHLDVRRIDDKKFEIDLAPDVAFAATTGAKLSIIAMLPTGGVEKTAKLNLELAKLGLTSQDPYALWPRPTCTTAMKTCLVALPDGELDLARCGDAFRVRACQGRIGVTFDADAMSSALHDVGTELATPAARTEANGLVGTDRADQFLGGAEQTVESRFEGMYGRWFMSATARDKTVDAARASGLDTAFARPFDYVEPHVAVAGNAAAMRQVAADAVLAELASMDLLHTEFGRSLEQLVHEFHAQHVASIKAFRETIVAEPYPGTPAWDVYTGDWLGTYTEIVIERATGVVVRRLVEID